MSEAKTETSLKKERGKRVGNSWVVRSLDYKRKREAKTGKGD